MRCPRCESSNGDDFFQNTVRQSRTVGGGNVLEGGLGSFEFDSQLWTCKKCMVRCISDKEFEEQKWQASLLNMSPEEKKVAIVRKTEEKAKEAKIEAKAEADRIKAEMKEWSPSDWAASAFGMLILVLIIGGIWYIVLS